MPSLTVENYLKAALQITLRTGDEWVSTGQLAAALGVSPGTVTSMLKTLAEADLAEYRRYEGIRLTKAGRSLAMRMLRRHRLIELFLVRTLNLTWDQVHEEAEHLEHAVSDYLIDRIDEFLGHPESDPHGDPIPSADGRMRTSTESAVHLSGGDPGTRARIVRVVDQESEFLRYLADAGMQPGAELEIVENNAEAGTVTVRLQGRSVTIGHPAAESVLVECIAADDQPAR